MLISIEAENGAGKSHTISGLCRQLDRLDCQYFVVKAPDYNGKHGVTIQRYLRGEISLSNQEADQLFKENRLEIQQTQIKPKLEQGYMVILDRWALSAVVYSKVRDSQVSDEYLEELIAGEFQPNLTLYIHCDLETIEERLKSREIQRVPYSNLKKAREVYAEFIATDRSIIIINNNGKHSDTVHQCLEAILNGSITYTDHSYCYNAEQLRQDMNSSDQRGSTFGLPLPFQTCFKIVERETVGRSVIMNSSDLTDNLFDVLIKSDIFAVIFLLVLIYISTLLLGHLEAFKIE